jgi:hypothetical protein
MEPNPENMMGMQVRLTLWPGGAERVLAEVHPHGAWVRWAGEAGAAASKFTEQRLP